MQTHLVTGYKGSEHIKSADQGSFNAAFFGSGQFVMEMGNQFEGSIVNNNTVRILDGDILMYGRHIRIDPDTFEDLTIETGNAGKNRIDLVCMTYEKNTSDGTEKAYLEVLKGSETEGTPSAPEYTDGNIITGAIKNQMPLYKLTINGVVLQDITPLFKTIPTYKTLAEQYAAQFQKACDTYLGALNILDTMEEVNANTQANQLAGALAVKQGISELNTNIKCISQKAPTGQRYLTADSGVYVANEKNTAFTDMTARDFYERASGYGYSLANIGSRCVALENKLTETGWSSISYGGEEPRIKANFCKKNGICYVINNENLQNRSYPGGIWMEVGTIPKGYRPNVTIPFIGWYGLTIFIGQILTSGVIKIYCNTAIGITGNAPQFNVSYPLF